MGCETALVKMGVEQRSGYADRITGEEIMDQSLQAMEITKRLERIEELLATLVTQRTIKEWYTTAEVAELVGKAEFTVREWCRLGRIKAQKKQSGRGVAGEWMISHDELQRIRNEGLLPQPNPYRHIQ
jgi:hypothetical protein